MRCSFIILIFGMLAAGQEKAEAVRSPLSLHLEPSVIKRPLVGQTMDQVKAILGEPDGYDHLRKRKGSIDYGNAVWHYMVTNSNDTLLLTFADGKLVHLTINRDGPTQRSRLDTVFDVAARVYLFHTCPPLRRKPVLLLNTNELQVLQACLAAGF